jgi:hypothetical protein
MVHKMLSRPPMRFLTDATIGFGIFSAMAVAGMGPSAFSGMFAMGAQAAGLEAGPAAYLASPLASAAGGLDGSHGVLWALALVFSLMFALNVAFLRHLRQSAVAARVTGGKVNMASLSDHHSDHDSESL